jgi:hypothetical protein
MAYNRTTWENLPSTATPISANLLNNIEQGILDIDGAFSSVSGSVSSVYGSVTSLAGSVVTVSETVSTLIAKPIGTVSANYILGTADVGKVFKITSSTAITITIPTNASASFPVGASTNFIMAQASTATFTAANGSVTVVGKPFKNIIGINNQTTVLKTDNDEWYMSGDLNERKWTQSSQTESLTATFSEMVTSLTGTKIALVDQNNSLLHLSSDSGLTWGSVTVGSISNTSNNIYAIAASSDLNKIYVAPYEGQIGYSSNSGTSFTSVGPSNYFSRIICSQDGISAIATINGNGPMLRTLNSGSTWGTINTGYYGAITSNGSLQRVAVINNNNSDLLVSTNSGTSFSVKTKPSSTTSYILYTAEGNKLFFASDASLYVSSNDGTTWIKVSENDFSFVSMVTNSNGTKIHAIGSIASGSIFKLYSSIDSGATWTPRNVGRNVYFIAYGPSNEKIIANSSGNNKWPSISIDTL